VAARFGRKNAQNYNKDKIMLGAGEIVVNSVDADGTQEGFEINLTRMIAENVERADN